MLFGRMRYAQEWRLESDSCKEATRLRVLMLNRLSPITLPALQTNAADRRIGKNMTAKRQK